MKKIISFISFAALAIGLLGSCAQNDTERIEKTEANVAKIEAAIGQYSKLKADMTTMIQDLLAEVGNRPAGEQNAIWDCIATMKGQCSTFDTAINTLKALVGDKSVSEQINALVSTYQLEGLAAQVQSIKEAIGDIPSMKKEIEKLSEKVANIDTILEKITALEGMIQTVSIIPVYNDGSIEAEEGILTVNFIVKPAVALSSIKAEELKDCITVLAATVKAATKASGLYTEIAVTEATVLDAEEGTVCAKADISSALSELKDGESLAAALEVKNGISDYATDFVKVTAVTISDYLPGVFSLGENTKVFFTKGNLSVKGNVKSILHNQTEAGSLLPSVEESYVIGGETLTAPTAEEWGYLLEHNKNILVEIAEGSFGLAVMPDGYAKDPAGMSWAELEADGALLLPAAGYAYGESAASGAGEGGSYWTKDAKALDFDCIAVYPASEANPTGIKQSIRLVKVVEQN